LNRKKGGGRGGDIDEKLALFGISNAVEEP